MRKLAAFVAAMLAAPAAAQTVGVEPVPTVNLSPTGTPLNLGDDQTARLDLGFTFDYFGQQFTQAWVSSNGFLSFLDGNPLCCDGVPIDEAPRNTIYGLWADLHPFGTSNPYAGQVTLDGGLKAFVAGWYGSHEYYNPNTQTFEIVLREDGTFSIRYTDVNLTSHTFLSGYTGPTSAEQYSILYGYGSDANLLDGKTYNFGLPPVKVVDCAVTPLDPACVSTVSPVDVSPLPSPVDEPVPTVQAEEPAAQAETTTVTEEPQETTEVVAEAEAASESETTTQAAEPSTAEEQVAAVEQAVTTEATVAAKDDKPAASATTAQAAPPPLPPGFSLTGPVAAASSTSSADTLAMSSTSTEAQLANNDQVGTSQEAAQVAAQGQQATQGGSTSEQAFAAAFGLGDAESASGGPVAGLTGVTIAVGADTTSQQQGGTGAGDDRQRQDVASASSPTQVLEALNSMSAVASPSVAAVASSGPEPSALAGDQASTINEMGNVPGFAAYAQASIPDRPFYQPVVIYSRNRPVDANMTMYRLLQSNSRTWDQLVEMQYER